jgi:MFS family permease
MFSSLIANSLVGAGQWRWIYYISLILNVLGGIGIVLFYKPPPRPEHEKSVWHQFIRLDWLGIFLFLTGLTLFLLGIFFGAKATTYAWNTAKVIACMVYRSSERLISGRWSRGFSPLYSLGNLCNSRAQGLPSCIVQVCSWLRLVLCQHVRYWIIRLRYKYLLACIFAKCICTTRKLYRYWGLGNTAGWWNYDRSEP